MPDRSHPPAQAAGVFIALATVIGAVVGIAFDQPSIGFVAGVGTGVAIAVGYWIMTR